MSNAAGQSGQNYFDTPVSNSAKPDWGPRALAVKCPFAAGVTDFLIDLSLSQSTGFIGGVQGVYIDNSLSADVLTLTVGGGTAQKIVFPANAQGYVPILASKPTSFQVSSAGGVTVPLIFLNVPVPAIIWGESAGGGGGATTPLGSVTGGAAGTQSFLAGGINPGQFGTVPAFDQNALFTDGNGFLCVTLMAQMGSSDPFNSPNPAPLQCDSSGNLFVTANPRYSTWLTKQVLVSSATPTFLFHNYDYNNAVKIFNKGPNSIFLGDGSTLNVTTATGFEVPAGATFDVGGIGYNYASLCAIAETSSQNVSLIGY